MLYEGNVIGVPKNKFRVNHFEEIFLGLADKRVLQFSRIARVDYLNAQACATWLKWLP